jgi:hypothetical protein
MDWTRTTVSPDGTHHVLGNAPLYRQRFDEVLGFHAPGLAAVRRGGEAWHITVDGLPAYTRRFRRTFGFYQGRAAVVGEDGWRHVLADGTDLYGRAYAWCGNYQGDRCAVRDADGHYAHLDLAGRAAYPERWRYAGDYRDGIAVVQASDGRSTHVRQDGMPVHGRWFLDLDVFHKGFARARDEGGWTHVDRAGTPAYARRFAAVEPFYNGQARVERFDGGLEVIGEDGATIIELRPALRSDFAELSRDMVGFWRTQTVATAVALGIFELLPTSADGMACQWGLDGGRTGRLLRALGELELVAQEGEIWVVTPKGRHLLKDAPLTLADAALEYAGPFSELWRALPEALRADSGWRASDVFADVARDERRLAPHHRMLRSYARHDYTSVPAALGLQGTERVIDAGGGLGTLAHLLLDAYPDLHVTVLDRPEVIAQSSETACLGLAWKAGDLFSSWGIEADAVVLARVLHDWADPEASRILRHAREALPLGGRLFIVEMLLSETGFAGALCDLHLLVATGGKERAESAYRKLLDDAGFALSEVRRIPALPAILVGVAQ